MGADEAAQLRLEFDGDWTLKELSEFLAVLRSTYASVLDFERSNDTEGEFRPPRHRFYDFPGPILLADPAGLRGSEPLRLKQDAVTNLALDGEPKLVAIHIASPGWAEVFGKLNPLGVIIDFIKWLKNQDLRREKLAAEVTHRTLENHLLANQMVKERVDLLRNMGYSKRQIRLLLTEQLARPLENLKPFVDAKNVTGSLKALPAPKTRAKKGTSQTDTPPTDDEEPNGDT